MLAQKVNANEALMGALVAGESDGGAAPVMATPLAAVAVPVTVAKTAGYVVGGGAVVGAAIVAYKVATG